VNGYRFLVWGAIILGLLVVGQRLKKQLLPDYEQVDYSQFRNRVRDREVAEIEIKGDLTTIVGKWRTTEDPPVKPAHFITYSPPLDEEAIGRLQELDPTMNVKVRKAGNLDYLNLGGQALLMTVFLLVFLWVFVRQTNWGNAQALSFGRSRAKLLSDGMPRKTFEDVAGVDEAKQELEEIVDFLRNADKYTALGAVIPKGVLLMGPPGCGKTLLGRAVAGEAEVPFFYISGSEFVEMFVGVGASRVRDLFEQAKVHTPCLVFVDELDAVGRQRGAGLGGGHDEREQTLNQLLVEMDGFEANSGIIIIAATNRPDILDPALLRPGRFDRRIVVDNPDFKGRQEILNLYLKDKPLQDNVDAQVLARQTPGFSGADLANLVNEAALLAARKSKKKIDMADFEEAVERVLAGPERKSRVISEKEKEIIAYHEAGHALVSYMLPDADPVRKVTILPRGFALGYTMHLPTEDRFLHTRRQLMAQMTLALGGRVAEEMVFDEITTGAQNDLETVTEIARSMVCEFGMTELLGPRTLGRKHGPIFLGRDMVEDRDYSEKMAQLIDQEIRRLVDECYAEARRILQEERAALDRIVAVLLEQESLDGEAFEQLMQEVMGPSGRANATWVVRHEAPRSAVAPKGRPKGPTQNELAVNEPNPVTA